VVDLSRADWKRNESHRHAAARRVDRFLAEFFSRRFLKSTIRRISILRKTGKQLCGKRQRTTSVIGTTTNPFCKYNLTRRNLVNVAVVPWPLPCTSRLVWSRVGKSADV